MSVELSPDADRLLYIMYDIYLKNKSKGYDEKRRRKLGDFDYICRQIKHRHESRYAINSITDLMRADFVTVNQYGNILFLTEKAVEYAESRFAQSVVTVT